MASPPRPSKFIEGAPSTRPDLLARTPTSNEHFYTILSEMDEFESRRRNQRGSQSSVESLPTSSNNSSPSYTSHPKYAYPTAGDSSAARSNAEPAGMVKEGRRSINFTRDWEFSSSGSGRRGRGHSESGSDLDDGGHAGENNKLTKKFVGRLRALTNGKEKESRVGS